MSTPTTTINAHALRTGAWLDTVEYDGQRMIVTHLDKPIMEALPSAVYARYAEALGENREFEVLDTTGDQRVDWEPVTSSARVSLKARAVRVELREIQRRVQRGLHVEVTRWGKRSAVLVPCDWAERARAELGEDTTD